MRGNLSFDYFDGIESGLEFKKNKVSESYFDFISALKNDKVIIAVKKITQFIMKYKS